MHRASHRALLAALLLLVVSLLVYFLLTPWVASVTGMAPRAISLASGFLIILSGIASMMLGKLTAQRGRGV